jgi:hypothetical protein
VKSATCLSALLAVGFFCQSSVSRAQENNAGHPSSSTSSHSAAATKPTHAVAHPAPQENTVVIPGPLRSFLRMAGISQQISREDVLPLLARNAYATGYLNGVPTEYLRLVDRYLHQARELEMLAGLPIAQKRNRC